jgi:hydroxymethylpyrimidine pyrophosphatase-like HAD family hydrolase
VAVENAVEDVRRIAKIIAPACSDDGVAQIIESILEDRL